MPAVAFLRMTAEFVGAVGPYTPLKSLPLGGGLKTDVFLCIEQP